MPDMTGYPEPYDTEVGLAAEGLMTLLGQTLKAGQAFFIDYGFPAREFIHPQRSGGTLMCHYRHHAHGDPFLYPGLQDVTAHVDFTRVARAARRAGLQIETWQTQAAWLIEEGILHELEKVHGETSADYRAVSAVQKLLSPAEMGELFKVLVLGQGPENKSALINLGL
jgi:SAM-dependent MidA family methyltransferase